MDSNLNIKILQDAINTKYPEYTILVNKYSSTQLMDDRPNTCKHINKQLKLLCEGTELNSEYAFCSMLANENTLVVYRIPKGSTDVTRSMKTVIGLVSYSKSASIYNCIDKYDADKNLLSEIPMDLIKSDDQNTIKVIEPLACVVVDVLVTGQGANGLGSMLIQHLHSISHIYLKSVNTAYWFYIKQGFKQFYHDEALNKYIELPYKFCGNDDNKTYCTNFNSNRCYPHISTDCPDLLKDTFKSWYVNEEGLIPLILPLPLQQITPGGANSSKSEYVTVLGRRRKIVMQGRKKMVMVSGTLISLVDAKKKQ